MTAHGYRVANVERQIPGTFIKQDMYGFGDLFAFGHGEKIIIQSTSSTNFSARKRKIMASELAHEWVLDGGAILLHGWKPKFPKAKALEDYELREEVLLP